jgi:hypothetical protein
MNIKKHAIKAHIFLLVLHLLSSTLEASFSHGLSLLGIKQA